SFFKDERRAPSHLGVELFLTYPDDVVGRYDFRFMIGREFPHLRDRFAGVHLQPGRHRPPFGLRCGIEGPAWANGRRDIDAAMGSGRIYHERSRDFDIRIGWTTASQAVKAL